MSSDPSSQLLNFFKQLVKQLDTKFASLEQQLDKIEASIDNLRAYNERFQSQINSDIKNIKETLSENTSEEDRLQKLQSSFKDLKDELSDSFKPIPSSPPKLDLSSKPVSDQAPPVAPPVAPPPVNVPPIGPPPLDQMKPKSSGYQSGFSELSALSDEYIAANQQPSFVKSPKSQIESQYGGLKETPILEALKEEAYHESPSTDSRTQKKRVQKQALQTYLEKLEKVIKKALPEAQQNLKEEDNQGFVDKGLTVVHGIIEFLFVAYRLEFPDSKLDYYAKAKNLSGQGLFKDVSLLEKLESIFNQIERNEKPLLARPLLNGLNERIIKLNEDFESKIPEAYGRL